MVGLDQAADVRRNAEYLAAAARTAGFQHAEIIETAGHPAVYAERTVDAKLPTALIYGHHDVQPVEPKVVIEVAFDVVARSELHESGFALRFPRIVRIRDDKPPEEIDTIERVREIYDRMLARESPMSS